MAMSVGSPDEVFFVVSEKRFEVVTCSPDETVQLGYTLAQKLSWPSLVILEGELGSGKTTLVKGIVAGLDLAREEEVTSPSFTLVHEYGGERKIYHADLYRVESVRELASLGLEEFLEERATVIVEWGEKFPPQEVDAQVWIRMELLDNEERRIVIEGLEP